VPLWKSTAALIGNWKRRLDEVVDENILFPNRGGDRMTRLNVTQRFALSVAKAAEQQPQMARRPISSHTIRHTTARGASGGRTRNFLQPTIYQRTNACRRPKRAHCTQPNTIRAVGTERHIPHGYSNTSSLRSRHSWRVAER
jgi:integrase